MLYEVITDATARRFSGMTLDLGGSVRQIDGNKLKQHEASLNQAIDGIVVLTLGDGLWAGLTAVITSYSIHYTKLYEEGVMNACRR